MRNYIILNNKNSNEINGLLIQELPAITKPKMRTQIEEIDGRAGDIVTQLGYAAYTKTISVGLYGDFDINEVISYFNSSGTVVFSNEPDKYYNYEIIDQIDFNRLIKFRTAKVKMHVQPFKYPTEEEPLVVQYDYVTNKGSDMSLDNTANALFKKINPIGNTSQVSYSGKNLLENKTKNSGTNKGISFALNSDGTYTLNGTNDGTGNSTVFLSSSSQPTFLEAGTYYTIPTPAGIQITGAKIGGGYFQLASSTTNQFTLSEDTQAQIYIQVPNGITTTYNNAKVYPMISKTSITDYEPYVGGIPSPNPSYPQDIKVVTGDNTINIVGKNLLSVPFTQFSANTLRSEIPNFKEGTYTFSIEMQTPAGNQITARKIVNGVNTQIKALYNAKVLTFDLDEEATLQLEVYKSGLALSDVSNFQIEKGSSATTYEPYQGQSYPLNLGSIELCKIGDYEDKPFKAVDGDETYDSLTDAQKEALTSGKWYKYGAIGKVVLDSSKFNEKGTTGTNAYYISTTIADGLNDNTIASSMSDKFGMVAFNNRQNGLDVTYVQNGRIYIKTKNNTSLDWSTNQNCKDWLDANTPLIRYILATPTFTELTDEDLIEQLEALKQANSYDGQTNISHQYNGSPFILDVAAVQKGSDILVVDNEGNIYARPTLDIEGTGMVNVYLEGNQMFQVDLSENNEIVIDTDEMEAYDPSTQALMNRQVTGNYDNFKIVAGNNNLKFSGDLTKATVTNYERWL